MHEDRGECDVTAQPGVLSTGAKMINWLSFDLLFAAHSLFKERRRSAVQTAGHLEHTPGCQAAGAGTGVTFLSD
jgi:hypothetical protein